MPATLSTVRSLAQIVAASGTAYYRSNLGLDPLRHQAITLSDLALVMAKSAASAPASLAIAQAYAMRPAEKPTDPVYGSDFVDPVVPFGFAALALFVQWARTR